MNFKTNYSYSFLSTQGREFTPAYYVSSWQQSAATQLKKNKTTMPVIYKSFQSVLANKEGKKLFYPRVVLTGNVDTEQVAKEIAELSSLSTGDSKNVIDNLVTVMTRHLQSSESVTLDGLGTFRLTMKSTMNGVEDPLKVSATQSTLRVRFLPTSKRNLDHTVSTRSLVTGVKCVRFDLQDTAGSGGNDGGSGGNDGDQGENPLG